MAFFFESGLQVALLSIPLVFVSNIVLMIKERREEKKRAEAAGS